MSNHYNRTHHIFSHQRTNSSDLCIGPCTKISRILLFITYPAYLLILVAYLCSSISFCSTWNWMTLIQNTINSEPGFVSAMVHILMQLPSLFIVLFLSISCENSYAPWINGEVSRYDYAKNERRMKTIRIITYFACVVNMALTYWCPNFTGSSVYMHTAVIYSIPLGLCILQSTWRLTFRPAANYAIAVANVIIYLTVLDMKCPANDLLGFISIDREKLIAFFTNIPDLVKNGIIITILVTMLKDYLSNLLTAITSRHPSNLSQRKRRNRRRLLTHWHYNRNRSISPLEDSTVLLLIIESAVFCAAMILALSVSTYTPASGQNKAVFTPSFSIYPLVVSLIFFLPAIMSVWTVSDEKLLHSEHAYLIAKGALLEPNDVKNATTHWLDFAQVLVNLYTNVSGLESEDREYHRISKFLATIYEYLSSDTCAKSKFFSDILWLKGNINYKLLRESAHEAAADGKELYLDSNMIQRARDVRFASDFYRLIHNAFADNAPKKAKQKPRLHHYGPKSVYEADPLQFVFDLVTWFFSDFDHAWAQRFSAYHISAHQGIELLKIDTILHFLRQEGNEHCALAWLGCKNEECPQKHQKNNSAPDVDLSARNRMEMLLLYPFVVSNCYHNRWGSKARNILLIDDIVQYYTNIADQDFSAPKKQLDDVIYSSYRHLLELDADISLLDEVIKRFHTPSQNDSGQKPDDSSASLDDLLDLDRATQPHPDDTHTKAPENPMPDCLNRSKNPKKLFQKIARGQRNSAEAGEDFENQLRRLAMAMAPSPSAPTVDNSKPVSPKASGKAHESLKTLAYILFADTSTPPNPPTTTEGEQHDA